MATLIGKVGIVMKGAWSSSATYDALDAVTYNNGLYISKQAVPANTLPTNTTYWQLASKNPKPNYAGVQTLYNSSLATDVTESLTMPGDGLLIVREIYGNVTALSGTGVPYFQVFINTQTVFQTQAFPATNVRASGASFPVSSGDIVKFSTTNQALNQCRIIFVPYA